MSQLAIVIVNYRSADLVRGCLATVSPAPEVSRIVIVNNDTESGCERAKLTEIARDDARVRVLESPRNTGFGPGVNQGVREAQRLGCDTVWILNPDVEVRDGCLTRLQAVLQQNPDALVSPVITSGRPPDEQVWFGGGRLDARRGRPEHLGYRAPTETLDEATRPASFLTGTALMTRVDTFRRLGGFREDLFLYWEDVDLSMRAVQMGIPMLVVGGARLWHKQGGSVDDRLDMFFFYAQRNRLVVSWSTAHHSLTAMLVGPGVLETLRLLGRPLLRERRYRLKKFTRSVQGLMAGIVAVRRLQRDPGAAVGGLVERRR
ncbi:glycosyltransferase family 2 protein [Geodermatophilus obscurus]|uniref:Glycosyl transferase family 2 n=1 Tax=Geodermatophilus obscurus (strain ATCC 25078 / DSM 43160 / JCM 3152 / CCUG 61914 / KCC A-0152 / KCTC 9177 / NBRC 13315 / NRRL B-3577 / G-20) TaxID=526225 RepID=D2S537_GEOOG|nr:glycosyltransferase family 2 protein [Geodermatophilus obscurus]ADB73148.1 glycosyl transferase family 2 [Geodermatophilus obscurus DSM 43160]